MRGVVCLGILSLLSTVVFVACSDSGDEDDGNDGLPAAGGDGSSTSAGGSAQGGAGDRASGGNPSGGRGDPGAGGVAEGGSVGSDSGGHAASDSGGHAGADSGGAAGADPGGNESGGGGEGGFAPPGAVLFSEDFEDGDYDGWSVAGFSHTASVVSNTGAEGSTHSLLLTSLAAPADYLGLYRTFTNLKPSYVSYWVLCGTHQGTRVTLSGTHPNTTPISIVFWGSLNTVYSSNGAELVQGLETWHHIEIRIDWDDATLDYYGDGVLREVAVPFYYGTSTSLGRMDFSHNGDGSCHLDQIEFRE